jgi:hypothetical protein
MFHRDWAATQSRANLHSHLQRAADAEGAEALEGAAAGLDLDQNVAERHAAEAAHSDP